MFRVLIVSADGVALAEREFDRYREAKAYYVTAIHSYLNSHFFLFAVDDEGCWVVQQHCDASTPTDRADRLAQYIAEP